MTYTIKYRGIMSLTGRGNVIDLTGERFGRLVVLQRVKSPSYRTGATWKCKCDCGKETKVWSYHLRKKVTSSCGCLGREMLKSGAISSTHGQTNTPRWVLWNAAKTRAKRKGVPFSITLDDIPPIPKVCPALGITLKHGTNKRIIPNSPSLDRIIPSRGYVVGNIQIISHKANTIKNSATPREVLMVYRYMVKSHEE